MTGPDIDEDLELEPGPVPEAEDDDEEVVFIRHWDEPTRKRAGVSPEVLARRARIRRQGIGIAATLVVVAGALTYLLWPRPAPSVPPGLAGVWRTSNPRYADRALEITPSTILFHNGTPNPAMYPISQLKATRGDSTTRVTIEYAVRRRQYAISLIYHAMPVPAIALVGQPEMMWYQGLRPDEDTTLIGGDKVERESTLSPLSPDFLSCIRSVQRAGQAAVAQRCTDGAGQVVRRDSALVEQEYDPFAFNSAADSTGSSRTRER